MKKSGQMMTLVGWN